MLLARGDQPLLVRRTSFFVLDLDLDIVNGVRYVGVQVDGLACERFDEDQRASAFASASANSAFALACLA